MAHAKWSLARGKAQGVMRRLIFKSESHPQKRGREMKGGEFVRGEYRYKRIIFQQQLSATQENANT